MRVVVTGATGNVGTAVLRRLREADDIDSIVGIARRPPRRDDPQWAGVEWVAADVTHDDLVGPLRGADAVVHLAWLIQPSHRPDHMLDTNVHGSRRVFRAAIDAGVPRLVHASSVGVYSAAPRGRRVEESWRRDGIPTSFYSRDKAQVEAVLDTVEAEHPEVRVVRLRPGLIFQRAAASEIVRYFLGRFVPVRLLRPGALPVLPFPRGVAFQAVHVDDVAAAYHRAVVDDDARGAFNVAADPVLDATRLGELFDAAPLPVPISLIRGLGELTWRLHVQPTDPGWVDLANLSPLMSIERARRELGWQPSRTSEEALRELLEGMHDHADGGTPVLAGLPSLPRRLVQPDPRDKSH